MTGTAPHRRGGTELDLVLLDCPVLGTEQLAEEGALDAAARRVPDPAAVDGAAMVAGLEPGR